MLMDGLGRFYRRLKLFVSPSQNSAHMPLFATIDILILFFLPPKLWFELIKNLRTFQKNIKIEDWSSISEIYPRLVVWMYFFFLFSWGKYTNTLDLILKYPDKTIIAELFIRYIFAIDTYIDSHDSREELKKGVASIKNKPEVKILANELIESIHKLDISEKSKHCLLRLIAKFRSEGLFVFHKRAFYEEEDLNTVIMDKEKTAGSLWDSWSRILSELYQVPTEINEAVAAVFFNAGMILQVFDDIGDAIEDYKVRTHNIFLAVTREFPTEWRLFQEYVAEDKVAIIEFSWIEKHLPQTFLAYKIIDAGYFSALRNLSNHSSATHDLTILFAGLRRNDRRK